MAVVTRSRVDSAGGQCLEVGAKAGVTEMPDGDHVEGERVIRAYVEDLGELPVTGVSVIQVAGAVVDGERAGIMPGGAVGRSPDQLDAQVVVSEPGDRAPASTGARIGVCRAVHKVFCDEGKRLVSAQHLDEP